MYHTQTQESCGSDKCLSEQAHSSLHHFTREKGYKGAIGWTFISSFLSVILVHTPFTSRIIINNNLSNMLSSVIVVLCLVFALVHAISVPSPSSLDEYEVCIG